MGGDPGCSLGELSIDRPAPAPLSIQLQPPVEPNAAGGGATSKLAIISAGAVVGVHEQQNVDTFVAAPTNGSERNTLRKALVPIACWGTVDARFAFDSSFIQPDIRDDIVELRKVVEQNSGALLSVFGHADPVGELGYNKLLSGRRARALFALVTRDVATWTTLAATPMGRDKWEPAAFETMRDALVASGTAAPTARPALIKAYMELLCTGADGKVFVLTVAQFLGKGTDAGGKASVQGCGEFNPVRVLSTAEARAFAAPETHPERDARNAPNRRVLIFLFPADSKVDVSTWPCPRATEGIAGCQKRLFTDAKQRIAPGVETREHPTERTFSCRFYDRFAAKSPCETIRESVAIRLYDQKGREIPNAVYRLSLNNVILQEAAADKQGAFSVVVPGRSQLAFLEWGPKPPAGMPRVFRFRDDLALGANPDDPADAEACLINLGYSGGSKLDVKVRAFQTDYQKSFALVVSGVLDEKTRAALREVYTSDAANLRDLKSNARG